MPEPLFIYIPLLLVLMMSGRTPVFPVKLARRAVLAGLAQVGFGLAKVLLLAVPLQEYHELAVAAGPQARNGWSAFIGMMTFVGMSYLLLSGFADVLVGLFKIFKRELKPLMRDPFWATGFLDFWSRWGAASASGKPSLGLALQGCAVGALVMWRGFSPGWFLWVALQVVLVLLDHWLVKEGSWTQRIPRLVRVFLTLVVFTLSTVLLYSVNWQAVLTDWTLIFLPPAGTLYSLFLDERLTTARTCWLLWAAVITVLALPGLPWWLRQGARVRGVVLAFGLGLLAWIFLVFGLPRLPFTPEVLHQYAYRAQRWFNADGNAQVRVGKEGWLYPKRELDHLTQKPEGGSLTQEMLKLQELLKAQGAQLLVLPVPDKIMLFPEPILWAKYWAAMLPANYKAELERLRAGGVDVLDMTEKLWEQRDRLPLYSPQDSFWRAEAMKEIAVQTSRHIRKTYPQVVRDETPLIDAVFMERHDVGDLARALAGEKAASFWETESVSMVGIRGLTGAQDSPVLVVGGPMIRVFDDPNLSFPPTDPQDAPAAWPTQLGALIGRSLEVAPETSLRSLTERIQGKKLVVWVVRAGEL